MSLAINTSLRILIPPAFEDVGLVPPLYAELWHFRIIYLISTSTLHVRCDYAHLTDEDTEAHRLAQGYTAQEQQKVVVLSLL